MSRSFLKCAWGSEWVCEVKRMWSLTFARGLGCEGRRVRLAWFWGDEVEGDGMYAGRR